MSERICYMSRSDRGGRLVALRLLGPHSDDEWAAPAAAEAADAALQGAAWVRTILSDSSAQRSISTLCVDTDGGVCSWLTASGPDPALIRATVEGAARGSAEALDEGLPDSGPSGRFPDLPGETAFEPLAEPGTATAVSSRPARTTAPGRRMAVLAVPDVPARLLLDALDTQGVRVGRVISLWHAAAQAWDPSGPGAVRRYAESVVVADDAPASGVVLFDAPARRLIWTWSSRGALLAGGSLRLRAGKGEHDGACVCAADLARLATEWLSWSIQLGVAPSRVVCVGSLDSSSPDALTPAGVGESLASRWPGATVDLVNEADPVGLTLRRIVAAEDLGRTTPAQAAPSRSGLSSLSRRPGRAHRSMHVWAALALVLAAGGVSVAAWQFWSQAAGLRERADAVAAEQEAALIAVDPSLAVSAFPVNELRTRLNRERERLAQPSGFTPPRPMLGQLDTMSYVLGAPGVELVSIDLTSLSVSATVRVADIAMAEDLDRALRAVSDNNVDWLAFRPGQSRTGRIEVTYSGQWR